MLTKLTGSAVNLYMDSIVPTLYCSSVVPRSRFEGFHTHLMKLPSMVPRPHQAILQTLYS